MGSEEAREPRAGGTQPSVASRVEPKPITGLSPFPNVRGWTVWNGDCLHRDAQKIAPADLFFADPPYNIGIDYGKGKKADKIPDQVFYSWLRDWMRKAVEAVRPGGSLFILVSDEWAAEVAHLARWELGLTRRNWIKWEETFGVQTVNKFARLSRHILYFVRPSDGHLDAHRFTFNQDTVKVPSAREEKYGDKRAKKGGKIMGDVWRFSRIAGTFRERAEGFPTQIPELLLKRIVDVASRPGDKITEFFSGSCSLGRVCIQSGRAYEGWELNPRYAKMGAERIRDAADKIKLS